jgi:hypothetical protein
MLPSSHVQTTAWVASATARTPRRATTGWSRTAGAPAGARGACARGSVGGGATTWLARATAGGRPLRPVLNPHTPPSLPSSSLPAAAATSAWRAATSTTRTASAACRRVLYHSLDAAWTPLVVAVSPSPPLFPRRPSPVHAPTRLRADRQPVRGHLRRRRLQRRPLPPRGGAHARLPRRPSNTVSKYTHADISLNISNMRRCTPTLQGAVLMRAGCRGALQRTLSLAPTRRREAARECALAHVKQTRSARGPRTRNRVLLQSPRRRPRSW